MTKISLTDGSGKWFSTESSVKFDEDTNWNGQNHISVATGSQWEHESLYFTAGGNWVLHAWSQWQGTVPSWSEIEIEDAVRWLVTNGHTDGAKFDELPEDVRSSVLEGIFKAEL